MVQLEQQSPAAAHWTRQRYESIFAVPGDPQQARRMAWVIEQESDAQPEPPSRQISQRILAFLVAHQVDDQWELENITVAEAARQRGVGSYLLGEFVAHARAASGVNIFLEVRESNQSARALYHKMGFEAAGLRKSYYSEPAENAVIYRLKLA